VPGGLTSLIVVRRKEKVVGGECSEERGWDSSLTGKSAGDLSGWPFSSNSREKKKAGRIILRRRRGGGGGGEDRLFSLGERAKQRLHY